MKPYFFVFCEGETEITYVTKGYKKGTFSKDEKDVIAKNKELAIERAKKLSEFHYPSTMVYKLLESLKG